MSKAFKTFCIFICGVFITGFIGAYINGWFSETPSIEAKVISYELHTQWYLDTSELTNYKPEIDKLFCYAVIQFINAQEKTLKEPIFKTSSTPVDCQEFKGKIKGLINNFMPPREIRWVNVFDIANNGTAVAKAGKLTLDDLEAFILIKDGLTRKVVETKSKSIDLGNIRPQDKIKVIVFSSSFSGLNILSKPSLVFENTNADVGVYGPVSPFWYRLSHYGAFYFVMCSSFFVAFIMLLVGCIYFLYNRNKTDNTVQADEHDHQTDEISN